MLSENPSMESDPDDEKKSAEKSGNSGKSIGDIRLKIHYTVLNC